MTVFHTLSKDGVNPTSSTTRLPSDMCWKSLRLTSRSWDPKNYECRASSYQRSLELGEVFVERDPYSGDEDYGATLTDKYKFSSSMSKNLLSMSDKK
jgi:hypothetical protein